MARSLAPPSELRRGVVVPTLPSGPVGDEGTGTIWLGDKEETVKPGGLIIIPHGTPHGGTKPNGRAIKAIAIKTPPQAPEDVKLLD